METEKKSKKITIKKIIGDLLYIIIPVVVVYILCTYVILLGDVKSGSMEPSVMTGDYIVVNRLAYSDTKPKRGDIISFYSFEEKMILLKRIIGLPGETISFQKGYVYIDGNLLEEDYLQDGVMTYDEDSYEVPKDSYFLMGDNRENSIDARDWGVPFILEDNIYGKLAFDISLPW